LKVFFMLRDKKYSEAN